MTQHVTSVCGAKKVAAAVLYQNIIKIICTVFNCSYRCLAYKQWAAVRMCFSPITLPPQPLAQSTVGWKSNTTSHCHGQEFLRASVPPTMRNETSGSIFGTPQSPARTSTECCNATATLKIAKQT